MAVGLPTLETRARVFMGAVPNEVVNVAFERGMSPMAAWREHFALTQAEVAARIGITQAAYAQMERVKQPRKATLDKVAEAMGLEVEQLRW
jgi:DNA-binding XRE family transcriptional regulator